MSVHGEAPGPGHALVVNTPGYWLKASGEKIADDDSSDQLSLSGEGMLACFWLSANPLWEPETWPEPGTFIKLPISNGFMEMARAEVNGWPYPDNDLIGCKVASVRSSRTGLRVELDNGTVLAASFFAGEGNVTRQDGDKLVWKKDS